MTKNNNEKIIEDIKWFMFDDGTKEIKNKEDFSHNLKFVTWVGDGRSFIVEDEEGNEYRVSVDKELL